MPISGGGSSGGVGVTVSGTPAAGKLIIATSAFAAAWASLGIQQVSAFGASASGTPGTTVADLQAGASKKLIGIECFASQSNAANTQLTVAVTYSDATGDSLTTTAAASQMIWADKGGAIRTAADAASATQPWAAKDITRVLVTTLGTGVGTRAASVSALEVPQ